MSDNLPTRPVEALPAVWALPDFEPPPDLDAARDYLASASSSFAGAAKDASAAALSAGRTLAHAKAKLCKHGEFLPWLAHNFTMTRQTAARLTRHARDCERAGRLLPYMPHKWNLKLHSPHVAKATGDNEWYTPPEYIKAAHAVMGGVDCDPASSEIANRTVKAGRFYTKDDSGLEADKPWGERVWMNPPYAQPLIAQFAAALVKRGQDGEVKTACVLVNNATETDFFQAMLAVASAVCLPRGRIRFLNAAGEPSGAPLQGQAILYIGPCVDRFREQFAQFGAILTT